MTDELIAQMYKELNEEITRAIDNEVLCNIFKGNGWSMVAVECLTDTKHVDMLDWIRKNAKGKYHGQYDLWVFEHNEDAIAFKLTWS